MGCRNCQCEYVQPAITSGFIPPGFGCARIATNQIGTQGQIQQPIPPASAGAAGTWRGAASGATGTHVGYIYESLHTHTPTWQQYLLMAEVSGNFQDGEQLELDQGSGFQSVSGYTVRTAPNGGADQTAVDCDTGTGTLPPGHGGPNTGPPNEFTIDLEPEPPAPSQDEIYELDTAENYSAVSVTVPARVTGTFSGATAMFVAWGTSKIRVIDYRLGPNNQSFHPGEEFTIAGLLFLEFPLQFGSPTNETLIP